MSPAGDELSDLVRSRKEAWVAHAALLDACERAVERDADASAYSRPLDRIERGRALTIEDERVLRDALVDYLGDAPLRDRAPGRALLRRAADSVDSVARNA